MSQRNLLPFIVFASAALLAVKSTAVNAQFFSDPAATPDSYITASEKTVQSGLYMTGYSTSFGASNSSVTLTIPALNNDSFTRTTGTLRLEYWVTTNPPTARGLSFSSGYLLSRFPNLAALAPRTSYTNLVQTNSMTVPPDGTYWFVMLLEEYDPANCSAADGFCVVDSLTGSQRTFGAGAATYPLTVALAGSGSGTVTSDISGINCPGTCSAIYSSPAAVTLTATPASGSTFQGWGGACGGTASCTLTMNQARDVGATFNSNSTAASTVNYSDIWWNPTESGWGLTLADHDSILFGVWYTYNNSGVPIWYVLTGGTYSQGRRLWSGEIWQTTGPSYAAAHFDTTAVSSFKVGNASFDFSPPGTIAGVATFSYTVGATSRTTQVVRQPFGIASPMWGSDYTDIWWNASESGWGLTLAQHGNNIFGVLYTYDTNNQPLWVVMPGVSVKGLSRYSGSLFTTTGPAFGSAFDPSRVRSTEVGSATLSFGPTSNEFTYLINGAASLKSIVRQPFGAQTPPGGVMDGAFNFSGTYPALSPVSFTERQGATATVNAFPGQVSVAVVPTIPSATIASLARNNGASVAAQIPRLGIYLFSVPSGGEGALITALRQSPSVIDAIPHIGVDTAQVISGPVVMSTLPATTSTTPLMEAADVIEFDGFDVRSITPSCSNVRHGAGVGYVLTDTNAGDPPVTVAQYEMRGGESFEMQNIVHQLGRIADGAYRQNTTKVINMSLGVTGPACTTSPLLARTAQFAMMWQLMGAMNNMNEVQRQQIAVVVSLGNCGFNMTSEMAVLRTRFPNALKNILFVGGAEQGSRVFNYTTDSTDAIYAPSVGVPVNASGAVCNGTSFAAPRVARLVAQLNKLVPNLGGDQLLRAIRAASYADPGGYQRLPSLADALAAAQQLYGGSCIFTYSDWSACVANVQSRTVVVRSPPACIGSPQLTRACSNQCEYSYTDWSACQSNNTQTRSVISSGPAGCTGVPVLTQACSVPQCVYVYSAFGACQPNNARTRTVISSSPAVCSGTPALVESCVYQGGGAGVAGNWTGTWTRRLGGFGNATYRMSWSLNQSGSSVSGTYSYTLTGCDTICGDPIGSTTSGTWFDGSYSGSTLTLRTSGGTTFTGTVSGNTVTGTSSGSFNGTFTMTHQ